MNWLQTLLRQSRNGRKFNLSQEIVRTRLREIQLGWEGWSKAQESKGVTMDRFFGENDGWVGKTLVGRWLARWREDCGWVCTTSTARSSALRTQRDASLALHIQDIALYNNSACYSQIYQPHSQFYMDFALQCRLYIERACYLRQPQSASQSPFIPITWKLGYFHNCFWISTKSNASAHKQRTRTLWHFHNSCFCAIASNHNHSRELSVFAIHLARVVVALSKLRNFLNFTWYFRRKPKKNSKIIDQAHVVLVERKRELLLLILTFSVAGKLWQCTVMLIRFDVGKSLEMLYGLVSQ